MADYIVAIDLGTSHLTGIVGEKKADGTFSIIAYDTENTISKFQKNDTEEKISCVYRGIIYNRDNTATQIGNLLKKLEGQLNGDTIEKVYVGIGGQSLHTIDHVETIEIADGAVVTEMDLAALNQQCASFTPGTKHVLGMAPAVYFLDGRKDSRPVGVSCKKLEAHYKLVIGRASIRSDISKSIELIPDITLAGIFVSPLSLADALLSAKDKEIGCALVDFGAGVTSVSVFKDGVLQHLCVIPLGGNLISRDLKSLQLTIEEAEKLKIEEGRAVLYNDDENKHIKIETDGAEREIKLSHLNAIIEARATEIVDNVYAQISGAVELRQLGSGIMLAGGAAEMSELPELIKRQCSVKARYATIQNGLVQGSDELLGNPLYMTAISLMLKGTENGVAQKQHAYQEVGYHGNFEEIQTITAPKEEKVKKHKNKEQNSEDTQQKTTKKGLKDKFKGIFVTNLFEED